MHQSWTGALSLPYAPHPHHFHTFCPTLPTLSLILTHFCSSSTHFLLSPIKLLRGAKTGETAARVQGDFDDYSL